uniref:F-box domain-containing protein n=1 Tax=Plectus sambesii TaxID=2011161 RepID=A0A914X0Y4_9BILA
MLRVSVRRVGDSWQCAANKPKRKDDADGQRAQKCSTTLRIIVQFCAYRRLLFLRACRRTGGVLRPFERRSTMLLDALPNELLVAIIDHLQNPLDKLRLCLVNRSVARSAMDRNAWQSLRLLDVKMQNGEAAINDFPVSKNKLIPLVRHMLGHIFQLRELRLNNCHSKELVEDVIGCVMRAAIEGRIQLRTLAIKENAILCVNAFAETLRELLVDDTALYAYDQKTSTSFWNAVATCNNLCSLDVTNFCDVDCTLPKDLISALEAKPLHLIRFTAMKTLTTSAIEAICEGLPPGLPKSLLVYGCRQVSPSALRHRLSASRRANITHLGFSCVHGVHGGDENDALVAIPEDFPNLQLCHIQCWHSMYKEGAFATGIASEVIVNFLRHLNDGQMVDRSVTLKMAVGSALEAAKLLAVLFAERKFESMTNSKNENEEMFVIRQGNGVINFYFAVPKP